LPKYKRDMDSWKFMKTGMLLLLALLVSGSWVVNLHADLPSVCKDEDDNATKEEKKDEKKKVEKEKEKPKTIEVEKKYMRIELSLKGYFEDPDLIPVSISTKNWSELKVTEPPIQGRKVKKGDLLLQLDLEKIKQRLDLLNSDLSMIDLDRQILSTEVKLAETLAPMKKKELDRMEGYVRQDFERFKSIDLPHEKKTAAMSLKSYRDSLAYATEELNQLKKMYEADDLTEETEEIILQRTENQVDRAKFLLEGAIKRNKEFNEVVVPREVIAIEEAYDRKKLSMSTIRKILPVELKKKKLEFQKLEEERSKLLRIKKELEFDVKQMSPHSPASGILYWGTFKRGKWSGTTNFEPKLRKAGMIKAHEEFLTVSPNKRTHVRIQLPEKYLDDVSAGMKGKIERVTHTNQKLEACLTKIEDIPINPGLYDLTVEVVIPEDQKLPLPGTLGNLKVVIYEKANALTLPSSAVFSEDADPDSKFVYLPSKNGKTKKKKIEVGKRSGDRIEILKGIRMGTKVLSEKPKS
jgi:HlyD family secretion protein